MSRMDQIIGTISDWVWSPVFIGICLVAGLLFSILTRFVQVRKFRSMLKLLFGKDGSSKTGISSFQAFAMALSGRVGTGNIVGVATAIAYGGPGAIVWMWIIAFIGASTAFVEATLAQIYKVKRGEQFRGGPAYYIDKGLNCKWLGWVFAFVSLLACGLLMPGVQSNGVAMAFEESFGVAPWISGVVLVVLLGLVIIGGVKRIAKVAQVIAPLMALIYLVVAIIVIIMHHGVIPETFSTMIQSAAGTHPLFGGILGYAISWGVKRGIYSNEAGQGTGAIVAAAAKVSHPVKQGLVQAFSVYIDTLLVCSATALIILASGTYNIYLPDGSPFLEQAPHLGARYVTYTQAAVDSVFPGFGNAFISFSLFFFVFTTVMAYYYYAETGISYLFPKHRGEKIATWALRLCLLAAVFYGSIKQALVAWQLGDIGVGIMAWINLLAILILFPKAIKTLRSYEKQKKAGVEPIFDPKALGIKNADYWEERLEQEPVEHEKINKE